jgi:hypothetical protein
VQRMLYAVCWRRSCSPVRRIFEIEWCLQEGTRRHAGKATAKAVRQGTAVVGDVPMDERGAKAR